MNKLVSIILSIAIVVGGIAFAIVGVVQFVNKDKYDSTVKATIVEVTEEWLIIGKKKHEYLMN